MVVPRFWAEGRIQKRGRNRQITVRRFGWSDVGQEEAQAHADERTREAFDRVASGEKLDRREPRIPYNGADGLPIREEILSYHGDAVITRNSYGAWCLNTPNVLFADVDFDDKPKRDFTQTDSFVVILGAFLITHQYHKWDFHGTVFWVITLFYILWLAPKLWWLTDKKAAASDEEQQAQDRLKQFASLHPDWHLRLYRTPAGIRALVMHRTFEPNETEVTQFFQMIKVDPIYARMCLNQHCFRARVSPKPWRIGIGKHINRYSEQAWPIKPERMSARARWIQEYEQAAQNYSSCRFMESLGSDTVHPEALAVQKLHDELCRAHSSLPIA